MRGRAITEFVVAQAALPWLEALGHAIISGSHIATDVLFAETMLPRCV